MKNQRFSKNLQLCVLIKYGGSYSLILEDCYKQLFKDVLLQAKKGYQGNLRIQLLC
jgi:hypothetical protein